MTLLLFLFASSIGHAQAPSEAPPNVVLILADDLGWGELGAYGQERIETPHLDRLAEEGARFTAAYSAAPVCAPSRCAILTGLSAGRCSVSENARPNVPISLEDVTLGLVLRAAGYRTAYVGKWGLGGELDDATPFAVFSRPDRIGFASFFGFLDQERAQTAFPDFLYDEAERVALPPGTWAAEVLVERAARFLEEVRPERPFFLFFAPTLPHREYAVPEGALRYGDRGWPPVEQTYASMISALDAEVGVLVEVLQRRGLLGDTVILFTSDNGPNESDGHDASFFASSGGLRGRKRDLYEGGLRVPLLVSGPGVRAGAVEEPVVLYDLLPTLAELSGVPVPPAIDGVSLVPLLHGEAMDRGPLVFSSEEARAGEEPKALFRIRDDDLALVELRSGSPELYDVVADPEETTDLAAARPADVERLHALRARLTADRPEAGPATLALDGASLPDAAGVPAALWLDFDRDGDPLASRTLPARRLSPVGGAGLEDGALRLPRAASGEARAHGVVPASPAFSFGRSSFTFRARVRLEGASGRMTVACARPAGRPARFTDWAILARASDEEPRIGVLFGDATVGGRGGLAAVEGRPTPPVVSALAIEDDRWHELSVRFDAPARTLTFGLDGRTDAVAITERVHYPADGPLVLGACLDEAGRPEGGLVGAIDDVVLTRGLGEPARPEPRRGALALLSDGAEASGELVVRAPAADVPARAVRVRVRAEGDVAVSPDDVTLLPGMERTLRVTARGAPGRREGHVHVEATDALLDTLAVGGSIDVAVTAELTTPASQVGRIEAGVLVLVLLGVVAAFRFARRRAG